MDAIKTILIAEDDYAISLAIKTIVSKSFSCKIIIAKDGELAWVSAQENDIDLIISDWNMPIKTGAELLEDIRSHERLSQVPFLMLTARSDKSSVLDAINSGVTAYMHKPFDRSQLISKINELLAMPPSQNTTDNTFGDPVDDSVIEDIESQESVTTGKTKPRKIIQEIAERLKQNDFKFPAIPHLASDVKTLSEEPSTSFPTIARRIERDPVVTAQIIAIANTAMYRGARPIVSLEDAITRLGIKETVNFLWVFSNASLYESNHIRFQQILQQLRTHASATAICARLIGNHLGAHNVEQLFFMGLLHDIGKILVLQILEEIAEQETIKEEEVLHIIASLHEEFGAMLLTRWQLPKDLQQIAQYHDRLDEAPDLNQNLLIIHLANRLTRRINHSLHSDDGTPLSEWPHIEKLEIDEDTATTLVEQVSTHMKENQHLH